MLKLNQDESRTEKPVEPWQQNVEAGRKIMVKCRSSGEEALLKTVISNDSEGRRVECQEETGCVPVPQLGSKDPVF